jgi:predicted GIY-YIG superfamily endonuclease
MKRKKRRSPRKAPQVHPWLLYRMVFEEGGFTFGVTSARALTFHDSHTWEGVTSTILEEFPSEESAREGEARAILLAQAAGEGCLNKKVPELPLRLFWVYVVQSLQARVGKRGPLPGFFYVGMTTEPARRLREHNGLYANGKPGNPLGGRYTSKHRPWEARALHGPYYSRSEALRAEYALKRGKRGKARLCWTPSNSLLCRGEGPSHPWVSDPTWKPPTPGEWRSICLGQDHQGALA